MPWDSDKSTAADPDNPAADEQLTADEWDAHVADQKNHSDRHEPGGSDELTGFEPAVAGDGAVPYGPVADRPAAGNVPNGTVYLITDLANNGGVLTEVVAGAWEIKQIGDDANRPDIVAGTGDFDSVDVDALDIGTADFVSTGDFLAVGPSLGPNGTASLSTTSTSYVGDTSYVHGRIRWDAWSPTDAQTAVLWTFAVAGSADHRLQNTEDGETIAEVTGAESEQSIGPTNYQPVSTGSLVTIQSEVRSRDGSSVTQLYATVSMGVQL